MVNDEDDDGGREARVGPAEVATSGTAQHELVSDRSGPDHRSGDRRAWFVAAVVLVVVAMAGAAVAVVSRNESSGTTSAVPLSLFRPPNFTAVGAAIGADGSAVGPSPYEYHHDGGWPDLGSSGAVYRLGRVDLSPSQVAKMATALGVQTDPVREPDGWAVDDGSRQLQVHETELGTTVVYSPSYRSVCEHEAGPCGPITGPGSSSSSATDTAVTGPATTSISTDTTVARGTASTLAPPPPVSGTAPPDLPDEQAAQDLAHDLLERMGVLDGDWQAKVADGAMMAYSCAAPTEPGGPSNCPTDPIVVSRSVTFSRVIDGRPAEGLAWSVDVGDGGAISSVYGLTATVEEVASYPLLTPAAAYAEIVEGDPFVAGVQAGVAASREFATVGSAVADPAPASAPTTTPPDPAPETTPPDPGGTSPGGAPAPTTTVTGPPAGDPPETTIPPPAPVPGPPIVIQVTGVERGLAMAVGSEDAKPVAYLVPSYHFTGSYDRTESFSGGNDWSLSVLAVDRSLIQPLTEIPNPDGPPNAATSVQGPESPSSPSSTAMQPHDVEPCGPATECVSPSAPTSTSVPPTTADPAASARNPGR